MYIALTGMQYAGKILTGKIKYVRNIYIYNLSSFMINSCFRVSCIFLTRDIVFSQGDEEGKCGGGV